MPCNSASEVNKIAVALGLDERTEDSVPTEKGSEWARFAQHLLEVKKRPESRLTVHEVLEKGHLAPLTKDLVMAVSCLNLDALYVANLP